MQALSTSISWTAHSVLEMFPGIKENLLSKLYRSSRRQSIHRLTHLDVTVTLSKSRLDHSGKSFKTAVAKESSCHSLTLSPYCSRACCRLTAFRIDHFSRCRHSCIKRLKLAKTAGSKDAASTQKAAPTKLWTLGR